MVSFLHKLTIFLFFIFLLSSIVSKEALAVTKKGVACTLPRGSNPPLVLSQLKDSLGVTWFYRWGYRDYSPDAHPEVDFIPMVWGRDLPQEARNTAQSLPGSYWLIWNEPNFQEQSNITPEEAVPLYKTVYDTIKSWDPQAKLIVGGVAFGGNTMDGIVWLERFFNHYRQTYGVNPPVNGWHFHAYIDHDVICRYSGCRHYSFTLWKTKVEEIINWVKNHGGGEIWVTEWGVLGSYDLNVSQVMAETLSYLENSPDITRYAWFATYTCTDGSDPNLNFRCDGSLFEPRPPSTNLTAAGQVYKNQQSKNPYSGQTPTPTLIPSPTATRIPSPTPTSPPATSTPTSILTPSPTPTSPPIPGDVNGDGHVNMADYAIFVSKYGTNDSSCDFNKNGTVDMGDYSILVENYGS